MEAKVLVVDDHPANLTAMEAVLSPLDVPVVLARSGEEALQRLLEEGPDPHLAADRNRHLVEDGEDPLVRHYPSQRQQTRAPLWKTG